MTTDHAGVNLSQVQRETLLDELCAYADTDLLCYFAETPELAALQRAQWEPVLQWAEAYYCETLVRSEGIMPVAQSPRWREHVSRELSPLDDASLVTMAALVTQLGSVLLALALRHDALDVEAAIAASQIDETFQAERWGEDAQARAGREEKATAIRRAWDYLQG